MLYIHIVYTSGLRSGIYSVTALFVTYIYHQLVKNQSKFIFPLLDLFRRMMKNKVGWYFLLTMDSFSAESNYACFQLSIYKSTHSGSLSRSRFEDLFLPLRCTLCKIWAEFLTLHSRLIIFIVLLFATLLDDDM